MELKNEYDIPTYLSSTNFNGLDLSVLVISDLAQADGTISYIFA